MFAALYKQLEQQGQLKTGPVINETSLTFSTFLSHVSDLRKIKKVWV